MRALAVTIGLIVLYYVAPLDHLTGVPFWLSLTVGLLVLTVVAAHQVRAIIRSHRPAVRAIEAVAVTVPLFIILFAATYFLLSQTDPANFSEAGLTRTDTLYFTVTIFATVGFGDITATSQTARVLVTVQMILDLIVLGAVIRVFVGAVQFARQNPPQEGTTSPALPDRDGGDSRHLIRSGLTGQDPGPVREVHRSAPARPDSAPATRSGRRTSHGPPRRRLQGAGLLEQVGGAGDDGELVLAAQLGLRPPVELEHDAVVAADDEQGRCPDRAPGGGPARSGRPPRDTTAAMLGVRFRGRPQRGGGAGAGAEVPDPERRAPRAVPRSQWVASISRSASSAMSKTFARSSLLLRGEQVEQQGRRGRRGSARRRRTGCGGCAGCCRCRARRRRPRAPTPER